MIVGQEIDEPEEIAARFAPVRGHPMARAAVEAAFWDLYAQARGVSLAQLIGATRDRVAVGVSVGIEPTLEAQLASIERFVAAGYARIKLKIKPGWDVAVARAVRERWPDIALQVDANSAYTLNDASIFRELDAMNLLLIEQPLHHDDIVDHARLQAQIRTPICLDESIHSPEHARWALDIDACRGDQYQNRAGRRADRCASDSRPVRRTGRTGLVRRHAGNECWARGEPGAGGAPQLHPPRRHLSVGALLPARHRCARFRAER